MLSDCDVHSCVVFSVSLSWDDSSSVSSGISDALDTDELNTSSSLGSYINTPSAPRRDIEEQVSDGQNRVARPGRYSKQLDWFFLP